MSNAETEHAIDCLVTAAELAVIGAGLRDIEERGIDAHLADVEAGRK